MFANPVFKNSGIYININIFEIYFFIYFFILFIYLFIYLFLLLFSGTQLRICVQVATPLPIPNNIRPGKTDLFCRGWN